ncbi:ATP-binding cassette transporter, putative [Talaromyces stipitatus ATCC 10500]|uniref:ATP-binding cassette transporter, putative n=1 Tax=Talaromyces stipitatus (strain ATCC 10500 / CBS 375.48 / QM 6759 / NRRL 1006) TaxID=441959 RepID=B8M889_TALSN|nr:ATP-binding cassette transporter, putative [Talaromyces stipitatus ATCC 10500]EED20402.1 ATP-binding cassette transporter, putative [Talaromyces stipitatus ATCC 10500]
MRHVALYFLSITGGNDSRASASLIDQGDRAFDASTALETHLEFKHSLQDGLIMGSTGCYSTIELTTQNPNEAKPNLGPLQSSRFSSRTDESRQRLSGDTSCNILQHQINIHPSKSKLIHLYRYASPLEKALTVIACLSAIAAGTGFPLLALVFGSASESLKDTGLDGRVADSFRSRITSYVLDYVYLAIAVFFLNYISIGLFIYTGEKLTLRAKEEHLKCMLRQNIGFFDQLGAGEVATRIGKDFNLVQSAISEKVGLVLTGTSTFITAVLIGFTKSWKLTLICLSTVVAIVVIMCVGSVLVTVWEKRAQDAHAVSGSIAEEILGSIRDTIAFGMRDKMAQKYSAHLVEARRWGFRAKIGIGALFAILMCLVYMNSGLCFWMGSRFLVAGDITLSDILTIILAVITGAFYLGSVGPHVQAISAGAAAASKIFSVIDRKSPIDSLSDHGIRLTAVEGNLTLNCIQHIYPSRPDVVVLDDIALSIPAGKTTAIVGASGSGKSSIVNLIERFYEPVKGSVDLDGHDIRDLNLSWLRQQIALVQQEPVLFHGTIKENISLGLMHSAFAVAPEEVRTQRIIKAAKLANAHEFISDLPHGYDSMLGVRGMLLSGGQKQRIAIARAIVSDPKILLLDEATSAIDSKSEEAVQKAINQASRGRTTVVIAHRLSTVRNADNIVVLHRGQIAEQGTHNELMELRGSYHKLVLAQSGTLDSSSMSGHAKLDLAESFNDAPVSEPSELDSHSINERSRDIKEDQYSQPYNISSDLSFVAQLNLPEWPVLAAGLAMSSLAGLAQPAQSALYAKAIIALAKPLTEHSQIRHDVNILALLYLGLALLLLVLKMGEGIALGLCSERLISRAREMAFRSMLKQDISFFDKTENDAGSLTSFLSAETENLRSVSGTTLGVLVSSFATVVGGIIIALAVGWKLTLVCVCAVPVILGTGILRFKILADFGETVAAYNAKSASLACEYTNAMRTVASLAMEAYVLDQYAALHRDQLRQSWKANLRNSGLYASAQSALYLAMALAFWYGSRLLFRGEYSRFQFFLVFAEVIFGVQSAGTLASFAGDISKGRRAARWLRVLADREPRINESYEGDNNNLPQSEWPVEFRNVSFSYPSRPGALALCNVSFSIQPGQYAALVGTSGSGKSTIISLLERFYDPQQGSILVGGRHIADLNLRAYRSQLALVAQEPTLYRGTIRDNILYGVDEKNIKVDEKTLIQACKDANIYDLILSLPKGFDTEVGSRGLLLSGGQKQRISIARALLRSPRILLLDEATSALDSESERTIQIALDNASKGRTTIAIAHRLNTIQHADVIFVFDKGRLEDRGTHTELMQRSGRYREMVLLQNLPG